MDATATSPASYAAIPDAALDACEEKVLTMLELSAQIAEGLAGGLATPPEATASVAADAARFMQLSEDLKEALAGAAFLPEHDYRRTAAGEVFRRQVDEMHDGACDDMHLALRAHAHSAVSYGPTDDDAAAAAAAAVDPPPDGDAAARILANEALVRDCELTAGDAGVRR